ncbi:PAAR domain-containing protein [Burkholderia sp. 3C]
MRRNYLRVGDKSSAGGSAAEGIRNCTHHGVELTFIGGEVICPTCRSIGQIAPKGQRRPGVMMGKDPALEGDICLCQCDPPPVMIASQSSMFQSFEYSKSAGVGFSSRVASNSISEKYIRHVLVRDASTGLPLPHQRYVVDVDEKRQFGETNGAGYAVIRTNGEKEFRLHVIFSTPRRELEPVWIS